MTTSPLSVKELSFRYGSKQALDNLSFDLPKGLTLLLGPNGAGKSTLFSLLTGMTRVSQGDIRFDNLNIIKHRHQVMKKMGVVFQQSTLDLDLTIAQNLSYFAALQGLSTRQALQTIQPILDTLELSSRLNDKVRSLNGGHRRRVELARCLIHRPKFLLLDEPTVGLDVASRKSLLAFVRHLTQTTDLTVLWATHLLEEVTLEDNLLLLSQGSLTGQGTCKDLLHLNKVDDIQSLFSQLSGQI